MELIIGAHMSTSSGFANLVKRSKEISANTFQIFSHNPRSWKVKEYSSMEFENFKKEMKKNSMNFSDVLVHSGYLINLASPKEDMWLKSIDLAIKEIEITASLGIENYNLHPGSHLGKGLKYAYDRIAQALDLIFEWTKNLNVNVLLENVARKGNNVGWRISQIGEIIKRSSYPERLGLTYDTCHGFDSNYDIRCRDGVEALLKEIDSTIGLQKFKMIHLNDSKYPLGAAKDRHELIGKGEIGLKGFKNFLSFEEILKRPLILETPGDDIVHGNDIKTVRALLNSL